MTIAPKFKVWHIPQLPMKSFEVECATYEEAKKVRDVLADYDAFQYENNVKGDYCNASGIIWNHPEHTHWHDEDDGNKLVEWSDVPDGDELDWLIEEIGHPEWFGKTAQ